MAIDITNLLAIHSKLGVESIKNVWSFSASSIDIAHVFNCVCVCCVRGLVNEYGETTERPEMNPKHFRRRRRRRRHRSIWHMWQTIALNSNSFIRFSFIRPSAATDKPHSCRHVLTLIHLLTFIFVFLPIAFTPSLMYHLIIISHVWDRLSKIPIQL